MRMKKFMSHFAASTSGVRTFKLAAFLIVILLATSSLTQASSNNKNDGTSRSVKAADTKSDPLTSSSSVKVSSSAQSPSSGSSSSSGSSVSFSCPEQFGYYPDHTDCTKYYVCVFGEALHESCTGGLYFSSELQTCDWPRNVLCVNEGQNAKSDEEQSGSVYGKVDAGAEDGDGSSSYDDNSSTDDSSPNDKDISLLDSNNANSDVSKTSQDDSSNTGGENTGRGEERKQREDESQDLQRSRTIARTTFRSTSQQDRNSGRSSSSDTNYGDFRHRGADHNGHTEDKENSNLVGRSVDKSSRSSGPIVRNVDRYFATDSTNDDSSDYDEHRSASGATTPSPAGESVTETFTGPQLSGENRDRVNDSPQGNKVHVELDPQQPQYDEAISPIVDENGGIHVHDGPGGTYGLVARSGSINPTSDHRLNIFVKPLNKMSDRDKDEASIERRGRLRESRLLDFDDDDDREEKLASRIRDSLSYIPVLMPDKPLRVGPQQPRIQNSAVAGSTRPQAANGNGYLRTHSASRPRGDSSLIEVINREPPVDQRRPHFQSQLLKQQNHFQQLANQRPQSSLPQDNSPLTRPSSGVTNQSSREGSSNRDRYRERDRVEFTPGTFPVIIAHDDSGNGRNPDQVGGLPSPNSQNSGRQTSDNLAGLVVRGHEADVFVIPATLARQNNDQNKRVRPRIRLSSAPPPAPAPGPAPGPTRSATRSSSQEFNQRQPAIVVLNSPPDDEYFNFNRDKVQDPNLYPREDEVRQPPRESRIPAREVIPANPRAHRTQQRPPQRETVPPPPPSPAPQPSLPPHSFVSREPPPPPRQRQTTPVNDHFVTQSPPQPAPQPPSQHQPTSIGGRIVEDRDPRITEEAPEVSAPPRERTRSGRRQKRPPKRGQVPQNATPAPAPAPQPPQPDEYPSTPIQSRPPLRQTVPTPPSTPQESTASRTNTNANDHRWPGGSIDSGQPFGLLDYPFIDEAPNNLTSTTRHQDFRRPERVQSTTTTTTTTTTTPAPQPRHSIGRKPRPTNKRLQVQPWSPPPSVPPSRPESVYPTPTPLSQAVKCDPKVCRLPDCKCGDSLNPGGLDSKQIPQIVLLTFDDAVNDLNYEIYEEIFHSGRKNPNGCGPLGTFYVSHEWTDYGQVQNLYSRGHEMASHGVTHSFGEKFSKNQWLKEINGQREILHLYGGVKLDDIRGMRAPFLAIGGNKMFEMLYEANFTYDSSMPVFENSPPFWPYTLDYQLNHECMITPCPTKSFPGLWEVGMVMWVDLRGGRCSMGDACSNPNDEDGVYEMLLKNFNRHYKSNRAPFGLFYHSAWFNTQHHRRGFMRFMDEITSYGDVFFTTNWQMLQWMRNPTPLSQINDFKPWQCGKESLEGRPPPCHHPTVCNVRYQGGSRFMKTCQQCPNTYPWVGNTGFGKSKSSG